MRRPPSPGMVRSYFEQQRNTYHNEEEELALGVGWYVDTEESDDLSNLLYTNPILSELIYGKGRDFADKSGEVILIVGRRSYGRNIVQTINGKFPKVKVSARNRLGGLIKKAANAEYLEHGHYFIEGIDIYDNPDNIPTMEVFVWYERPAFAWIRKPKRELIWLYKPELRTFLGNYTDQTYRHAYELWCDQV